MKRFLSNILSAILGLWLALKLIPGVAIAGDSPFHLFGFSLTQNWQILLLVGILLGILNYFARPFLKNFNLPYRKITLHVFSILFGAAFIWVLGMIFENVQFPLFLPLFYSAILIWLINVITQKLLNIKKA